MKGRDIKKALLKKGFVLDRSRSHDHEYYVITNPSNGRYVRTKFSMGTKGNGTLSGDMESKNLINSSLSGRQLFPNPKLTRMVLGKQCIL